MNILKHKKSGPCKSHRAEALRYVENARLCLQMAEKDGDYYSDPKYVKMAGNTLWNGVLYALKEKFPLKGRPDIIKYRKEIARQNKKMLKVLNAGYDTCHLSMGYDGNPSVTVAQEGIKTALKLIDWAAPEAGGNQITVF